MEKNEEEPNEASDHSMEILASLDFFQAVIDSIQDHQEDNKKRIDHQKDCISQFLNFRSENRLLREIFEIDLLELAFESFSKFEEGYEAKLSQKIRTQKEAAKEGRRNQKRSFVELVQQLNHSDEGTFVFNKIKAMGVDVGIILSIFLVEYFLMIWQAEWTVIESKIRAVKDVIQSESLEENSVIIDMFVSMIEFVNKEMGRSKKKRGAKKEVIKKENVSHSKTENDLLGMIFFEILNFEIAFCRPIFSTPSADGVLFLVVEKYIRQLLVSKFEDIRSCMNKLKAESASTSDRDPMKNKLKEKLTVGIGSLWKKLELHLKN